MHIPKFGLHILFCNSVAVLVTHSDAVWISSTEFPEDLSHQAVDVLPKNQSPATNTLWFNIAVENFLFVDD